MSGQMKLDQLCVNTIRTFSMDAIQNANSGHPGMPMGMASAAYVLWAKIMKHNPKNPHWINRDRFVLSAGHGCMLLYSILHLTGYDLSLEEIKRFRQWKSKTPGHPEYGSTPGVEVTTGPLGQGISNAVGMAISEKYLGAYFNKKGFPIVDHKIYVIAGDGCLQEGISSESSSLAGHLGLNNLIVIYDDNHITIDGDTALSFTEDVVKRYRAYGWFVQTIHGDGNNLGQIEQALIKAKHQSKGPSLIKLRTHIGFGSPHKQDSSDVHGFPLGEEEVNLTKKALGWNQEQKFFIPRKALNLFKCVKDKGFENESSWVKLFEEYVKMYPDLANEFRDATLGKLPQNWSGMWDNAIAMFNGASPMATREAQGKILDTIMPMLPFVLGGSADLTTLNNTCFKGAEDFSKTNRMGRYIHYGVREHGMGAIMNGISVSRILIPYGGTFLCFSDYMHPAIRLAAISNYPSIYIYTHDSIAVGENGPTHQPVEHLAALRSIPGLIILRPADAYETLYAWKFALENRSGPKVIVLTKQEVPILNQNKFNSAVNLEKGAYILKATPTPKALLIGTGSEVHLALRAHEFLLAMGIETNVISMPSWELFEKQTKEYQEQVLPSSIITRLAIEAGVKMGWERYIGSHGDFVGMSGFGASAPGGELFERFGFTVDAVVEKINMLLSSNNNNGSEKSVKSIK